MTKINRIPFSELSNFTEKQKEADEMVSKFKYFLFGGAKGGGKSRFIRWELLKLLLKWGGQGFKNVRVMLGCEDYPSLKDRQVTKINTEFPRWLGELATTTANGLCFTLKPEYGGGIMALRNLDDPSKYDSSEFAAIGVDELTKNTYEKFERLRTCLRWAGIDNVKFIAGTNPGGVGHDFVKKYFIDSNFPEDEPEKEQFGFLQSLPSDNPYNSPLYIKQLEAIQNENLRKALLFGDWDVFEGQFFAEFRRDVHVIKPFSIPKQWKRYLCMDYGWTAPSAVYWVGINSEKQRVHYRELHKTKLTPVMVAENIIRMTDIEEIPYIAGLFVDPSMFSTKAGEDAPALIMQQYFKQHNFPIKVLPANNARIPRASKMRELLRTYEDYTGKETAKILFFNTCVNAVVSIPTLQFSDRNYEDVDTNGNDHAYDAICYGFTCDSFDVIRASELKQINESANDLISIGGDW